MSGAGGADGTTTVLSLQMRLSELQTLWDTAKTNAFYATSVVDHEDTAPVEEGGTRSLELQLEHATSKPASPPTPSPCPHYHRHLPHIIPALVGDGTHPHSLSASRESIASVGVAVAVTPHAPTTPPTGTPRSRRPSVVGVTLSSEHKSNAPFTLPPIQAPSPAAEVAPCPQCKTQVAHAFTRFCAHGGRRLSG